MKGILKLGVVLTLYATVACVGLAFVYAATEKVIAERQQADLDKALKELFPAGDGFTDISGTIANRSPSVSFGSQYVITRGSERIGVAIRAGGSSYGGPIALLVGVGADGKISGVKILEHADTPGLGANAADPKYYVNKAAGLTFYGQFAGKSVQDPFEAKEDVIAITAATITSRAVAAVVKAVGIAAAEWFAGNGISAGGSK
jgi:electron transport complex protein RnfG